MHDHTVISCGWDRVIKVHMDERQEHSLGPEQAQVKVAGNRAETVARQKS